MTLLVWGTYDRSKPRARILLQGLRGLGVAFHEVHVDVWAGARDKGTLNTREKLAVIARYLAAIPRLINGFLRASRHEMVLVPYPGLFDLFVLLPFARLRATPIVWDVFISPYDTIVNDRRLHGRWHPISVTLFALEWLASRFVTSLFLDTEAHARRFEHLMGLRPGRVGAVPLGTDPARFAPRDSEAMRRTAQPFRVLFYGQYIPLHGIETIVRAAHIAEQRGARLEWVLVGAGQEHARITALIDELGVRSVQQRGWVPPDELLPLIHNASVGLGIFGTSHKALSVVPNKVYELAATQTTIITADTPAMREFAAGHPRIHLVPPGDPGALAACIMRLANAGEPENGPPLPIVGPADVADAFLRVAQIAR